jgi:hypothetical protein
VASLLLSAAFLIVLLAFVNVFFAVLRRLEVKHPETWHSLSEPRPWKLDPKSRFKTAGFIYLSGAHRSLGDMALTTYVYLLRGLLVLVVLGFVWKYSSHV